MNLPIDLDILQKRMAIPSKLAELSYTNEQAAIELMRAWGEKKIAITPLFDELTSLLKEGNQNDRTA